MTTSTTKDGKVISDIILKDIIDLLELSNLPKSKQEEYHKIAEQTVTDRAFSRLTDILEKKGLLDGFQKVEKTDKDIRDFLLKHNIDLDALLADEAILYKIEMKTINDVISVGIDVQPVQK